MRGISGRTWAGHNGYADQFVQPKLFPGRMAEAACWKLPSTDERAAKAWLSDAPRMIFISDMGDALSQSVPFDYLKVRLSMWSLQKTALDIMAVVTKRPRRMAEFGRWLLAHGIGWPDNLVAMTTVTSAAMEPH